jgi:hypothetical protein
MVFVRKALKIAIALFEIYFLDRFCHTENIVTSLHLVSWSILLLDKLTVASREIRRLLLDPYFHYRIQTSVSLVHIPRPVSGPVGHFLTL